MSHNEERSETDVVLEAEGRTYESATRKQVACPACGQHEFTDWPWGCDAHAAHTCSGVDGASAQVGNEAYRVRSHIFFRAGTGARTAA